MKNLIVILALALCAGMFLDSCIAPRVERIALFEPAQLAWPDVKSDLEAGYADGMSEGALVFSAATALRAESVKLEDALRTKSRDDLRLVPWPTMKPWAERGIAAQLNAGEIGPGVAQTFTEHLSNFNDIMNRLRGTTQ